MAENQYTKFLAFKGVIEDLFGSDAWSLTYSKHFLIISFSLKQFLARCFAKERIEGSSKLIYLLEAKYFFILLV